MNIFEEKYLGNIVHCDTEEKAEALIKLAKENGWKFPTFGFDYSTSGTKTCLFFAENFASKTIGFGTYPIEQSLNQIIEFEFESEQEPESTQEDKLKSAMEVIKDYCATFNDGCYNCMLYSSTKVCPLKLDANKWDLSIFDKTNLLDQEIVYGNETGMMHALVKGDAHSDDRLVYVSLVPLRVEDNEPVYAVEYIHEDKFEERKASELERWSWA